MPAAERLFFLRKNNRSAVESSTFPFAELAFSRQFTQVKVFLYIIIEE